ncbi:MAG: hypothetical protein L6408_02450 [Nanoarchaeota archaeon]|nr:hypothetical protein [Nanoarchaeota archaeon]
MKKRGQVMGTPFIMIFALVVGALVLVGGLYYVYRLTTFAGEISIAKEINDFKTTVKAYYYLEEGNSKTVKISLPSQAKNICFHDSSKDWKPVTTGIHLKDYPIDFETKESFYQNYLSSFKTKNMFAMPTKEFKESAFEIPYLKPKTYNPLCVRNNQNIKLISMGDHVEVTYAS